MCNGEVAGLSDQDGKDWAVSLSYLHTYPLAPLPAQILAFTAFSCKLIISPSLFIVHAPPTHPTLSSLVPEEDR